MDAVALVAGNQVSRSCSRSANGVARTFNTDAIGRIADRSRARSVGSDVVALNNVVRTIPGH